VVAAAVLVGLLGLAFLAAQIRDDGVAAVAEPCGPRGSLLATNTGDERSNPGSGQVHVGSATAAAMMTGDWIATDPNFSPDGHRLVVMKADDYWEEVVPGTELWTIGVDGSSPLRLTSGHMDREPAWSPDGDQIVFSRQDGKRGQLWSVPSAGGTAKLVLSDPDLGLRSPEWSPDGQRIAYVAETSERYSYETEVWITRARGGGARHLTGLRAAHAIDWHPDGKSLLVTTLDEPRGNVYRVEMNGDQINLSDQAAHATWSRDGKTIYFLKADPTNVSSYSLAQGHESAGHLVVDRIVAMPIGGYLYEYFGFDVGRCAE
jgi:Tol biopolymer transport system component